MAILREEKWRLVINGEEGPAYGGMGRPVFSPDGQRLAFSVKEGEQWFLTIDGNEGEPYDYIFRLLFASGQEVYYVAQRGPNVYFVAQSVGR